MVYQALFHMGNLTSSFYSHCASLCSQNSPNILDLEFSISTFFPGKSVLLSWKKLSPSMMSHWPIQKCTISRLKNDSFTLTATIPQTAIPLFSKHTFTPKQFEFCATLENDTASKTFNCTSIITGVLDNSISCLLVRKNNDFVTLIADDKQNKDIVVHGFKVHDYNYKCTKIAQEFLTHIRAHEMDCHVTVLPSRYYFDSKQWAPDRIKAKLSNTKLFMEYSSIPLEHAEIVLQYNSYLSLQIEDFIDLSFNEQNAIEMRSYLPMKHFVPFVKAPHWMFNNRLYSTVQCSGTLSFDKGLI